MPASTALRTFGIELEVTQSVSTTLAVLQSAGINAVSEGYNHTARTYWKVVTDGSVDGGSEVVSPILRGEEGIADARRVAEALVAGGISVDRRCGFHVHVGANDLSADDLRSLVKRYAAFEDKIDAFMPLSRRGSANQYCRSMAQHAAYIDNFTGDAAMIARRLGDRYRKLNVQSLWRQGTVEFRQHSGTVEADKIENWVRFCVAFVDASKAAAAGQFSAASIASEYEINPNHFRRTRQNWAEVVEQIEAAGGTMQVTAPRARTYRITGPSGEITVTTHELLRLYTSANSYDLNPVRFASFWHDKVAPILRRLAPVGTDAPAEDTVFAGMTSEVAQFFAGRAERLARHPSRARRASM